MRRAAVLAMLYGAGLACAVAAPGDQWIRVRSANFDLYTDAGESQARTIIQYFERVHSFFEKAGFGGVGNPVCLLAFRSEKEYQPYRPNEVAAAYFQPGMMRDYIVSHTAEMTERPELVVHEYTHLMVRQSKKEIPIWLNEGLAELYSNMQPQGKKVLVGSPIAGRLRALVEEQWIGVDKLTAAGHDSPLYNEKNRAGIFYAESWLLVHMLFLESNYRPHYHDMVVALEQGGSAREAFQKAYGKPMAEVEKDLHAYIRRNTVSALLFDVDLPKSSEAPEIEPGASLQARLMLAGLQSDTKGKQDGAKAALQEIERDFPNRWEVERGWAEFYLRGGSSGEAAKHYAKALELGCNDEKSLLEYGKVLGFEGRHKDAVPVLQKAVAAEPENREAHFELGMAMVRAGLYGASLAEFHALKKVDPDEAWRYFYHLGYAIYRLGDLAQALQLAEKAQQYAKAPQEQTATEELMNGIAARKQANAAEAARKAGNGAAPVTGATDPPVAAPVTETVTPARDDPPTLQRRTAVETKDNLYTPPSKLPSTEGPLRSTDCRNGQLILHVGLGGGERLFLIDDPKKVIIASGDGAPVEFTCGPQKGQLLKVSYQAPPSDSPQYAGVVRGLEFK